MSKTYAEAGVSIAAGDELVRRIQTFTQGIGGFAGTYPLGDGRLLAAATDGVGTKLELAQRYSQLQGLGQDLVAMCVNDLITIGARPLFFLDYYACGKLEVDDAETVIFSIQQACQESNCLLLGGETAEMPGFYPPKAFDLAGFAVGLIEPGQLIDGSQLQAGDVLLGLPSSGLHSNGFSLVRRLLEGRALSPEFIEQLLTPTRLYVKPVLSLLGLGIQIKAMAHITGGGVDNLQRVLPDHLRLELDLQAWAFPPLFRQLQEWGQIEESEMRKTFNCGIGLVLYGSPSEMERVRAILPEAILVGRLV